MKKYLALKVDVDTLKGTLNGVPQLINLFKKYAVGATFLFSVGPDHTGRAIKRVFRKGFFAKVKRTSVIEHYGFPTLLYGTVWPGPDIGKLGANVMRRTRAEGFEVGIHCWDHVRWQDGVMDADEQWTRTEMMRAQNRFCDIFKTPAKTHGAAGWQMNTHALRLTQSMGFDYCSDGRALEGEGTPHYPVVNAEIISCPQLPTTLPTLDELIGLDGVIADNVHEVLLAFTASNAPNSPLLLGFDNLYYNAPHVFTMHAELEGLRFLATLEQLILGWQAQGYTLVATETIANALDRTKLAYYVAEQKSNVAGRSGSLFMQGKPFLPNLN